MRKAALTFLFWLTMLSAAQAATTYYVKSSCTNNITTYNPGADTCTGGSSRVYSTINNAFNGGLLTAGDTLTIRAGTYVESIDTANGNVPSGGSDWGTGALTIQGAVGETVRLRPNSGGQVVRMGVPTAGQSYKYFIFKNLIFDGLNFNQQLGDIVGVGGPANGGTVDHIKFDGVEIIGPPAVNGIASNCLHFADGNNIGLGGSNWVVNSRIHQCGSNVIVSGGIGHGHYIETPNNLFENNEIYDVQGFGIQNYASSPSNNIYRNLRIHDVCLNLNRGCTAFLLQSG